MVLARRFRHDKRCRCVIASTQCHVLLSSARPALCSDREIGGACAKVTLHKKFYAIAGPAICARRSFRRVQTVGVAERQRGLLHGNEECERPDSDQTEKYK